MPTARPMMPSSDRLVSNTRASPNFSCKPRVTACTPPLGPTSSPNTSTRGLIASSCSSVRRIAVTMLMRWPSDAARRRCAGGRIAVAPLARPGVCMLAFEEDDARRAREVRRPGAPPLRRAPRRRAACAFARSRSIPRRRIRRHQIIAQLGQRIARPFRFDQRLGLVGLRVLEGMALEPRHGEPQQRRARALAHERHRLLDQARRLRRARCRRRTARADCGSSSDWRRCRRPASASVDGTEMP